MKGEANYGTHIGKEGPLGREKKKNAEHFTQYVQVIKHALFHVHFK